MGVGIVVNWWALALRGLIAMLFGIVAFVWTGAAFTVLVVLFAAYMLVTGVLALIAGIMGRSWMIGLQGVLGIAVGALTFRWPGITALILVYLVAAWAIATGVTELAAAFLLRRVLRNEWLLVLGGIVSFLFGALLLVNPLAGMLTITWIFGAYALISGVVLLLLALRLRGSRATLVVRPLA
jgi:uncharacterized membrane protein HdeD (DUF308 family)